MTPPRRLSFGIKTSQMGSPTATSCGCGARPTSSPPSSTPGMGPHRAAARRRARDRARGLDAARRAGRADEPAAARHDGHQQPPAAARRAGKDGGHRRPHLRRAAGAGTRRRRQSRQGPEGFELVRRELEAYGIDIVTPAAAAGALAEACTLIRRMWTEAEPFDFDGHHYRLRGAVCEPKPLQRPHPPILLGSGGERLGLRVVAEHADIWSCPVWTAEEFERKSAVLDEHCAAIDRDPSQIRRSVQVLVSGDDSLAARRSLADFVAAGADHLVLAPRAPYPTARWLATEVVEPVRDQVAA